MNTSDVAQLNRPWMVLLSVLALLFFGPIALDAALTTAHDGAHVSGVVTTGVEHRPIAGAIVTLSSTTTGVSRSAITDEHGRFALQGLMADRYTLSGHKAGFLEASYGTWRPGQPGVELLLASGQSLEVAISMVRGATLSGAVVDDGGRPIRGAHVVLYREVAGTLASSSASGNTDGDGRYRVYGIEPGEYLVSVDPTLFVQSTVGVMGAKEVDAILTSLRKNELAQHPAAASVLPEPRRASIDRVFFPNTTDPAQANAVVLAAGDDQQGIDITLRVEPTATVSGRVVNISPEMPIQVVAFRRGGRSEAMAVGGSAGARTAADGSFRLPGLNRGDYAVVAHVVERGQSSGDLSTPIWARTEISVGASDVENVVLALEPGVKVPAFLATDGAVDSRLFSDVQVQLKEEMDPTFARVNEVGVVTGAVPTVTAAARPNDRFVLSRVEPGRYSFSVSGLPKGWWLRSAMVGTQDALDVPVELGASTSVTARLTVTGRHTLVHGRVLTGGGGNPSDYFLVVCPVDRTLWHPGSRRVRLTRAGNDGMYRFEDLPGGDYWIGAFTDVTVEDLNDRALIGSVVSNGIRVTVVDFADTERDLKVNLAADSNRSPQLAGRWVPQDPTVMDNMFDVGIADIPGDGSLTIAQTSSSFTLTWDMPAATKAVRERFVGPLTPEVFSLVTVPGQPGTAAWQGDVLSITRQGKPSGAVERTKIELSLVDSILHLDRTMTIRNSGRVNVTHELYAKGRGSQ